MDETNVLESVRETGREGVPAAFELVASKLRCPPARPGTVSRWSLIDRLARSGSGPVVSVVAPAGYGKTTLLSQWAGRNGRGFAWVQVDERDNDPKVLLTYIAAALDGVQPVGGPVFDALASPVSSVPGSVVPRLGSALASMTVPVVLVLDDVHLLRNSECRAALSLLADHVPAGSRLVLAGRAGPPVRVARLRAEGRITEIGAGDLLLTAEQAAALLRGAEVAVEQMRADADEAARRFAAAGTVPPATALLQGIARVLSGDLEGADAFFEDAVSMRESGAPDTLAEALSERALLAMARGDWSRAEALAAQAAAVTGRAGIDDLLTTAVQARVASHRGDRPEARRELIAAQRMRPSLGYAAPHLAVQARIELTRAYLALDDMAGARTVLREIDEVLLRRPDLGTLAGQTRALQARLAAERRSGGHGASSLTAAELRVLPLLATHLSGPEIAGELFLSPHTVKSQQLSLYRKLGAASRSQAIARARELGLLEG
jgi:ATP/maltotriose-dependent transcriptional regulator MalT